MADIELVIKIDEELYNYMQTDKYDKHLDKRFDYQIRFAVKDGTPLPKIFDRENSEIRNEVKDLSKRVETLEKQMKENKEEQLKKLKAELDYAKFCCTL